MTQGHARNGKPSLRGKLALGFLGISLLLAGGGAIALSAGSAPARRAASNPDPFTAARIDYAERNYAQSETRLREILEAEPENREAMALLGRSLLARGRLTAAAEIFSAILKADPKNLEAARGLGAAHSKMGQADLGILYLRRATEIDPKNPEVWKELGLCQRESDPMGALSSLQQSLALDGAQADLTSLLSELATASPASLSRAPSGDPFRPRAIDPASLVPAPRAPDPTQHFPRPGGKSR